MIVLKYRVGAGGDENGRVYRLDVLRAHGG
jgi:hypothetical protein